MASTPGPLGRELVNRDPGPPNAFEKAAILRELETILSSPFFQTSKRCQQFLSYVVRHQLEGNLERLKERTIGVDLFQRPVGYSTGDDPVVRVQAGEVRRRLEQYYHSTSDHSPVRIELHVGSYAPQFKWEQNGSQVQEPPPAQAGMQQPQALPGARHLPEQPRSAPLAVEQIERTPDKRKPSSRAFRVVGIGALVALVLLAATLFRTKAPKSSLEQFWSPALSSSEPVLICMAKPSVYLASEKLYERHSKEKFAGQFERLSQRPDLQPNDKLVWGDMVEYPDYGLAAGDVYAAVRLSAVLGQIGKTNQVRIGGNYSFEDLRNFPAVVIGAFNNRWTMQMTSNLHFRFAEEGGQSIIREEGLSGRRWYSKTDPSGKATEDFAVVTRLLNSKTGQFVVVVAGIKSYGTQAAGEFVSGPEYLEKALRTAPPDWKMRNLQIVIQTAVTDSVPGPPEVVATYVW